MSEESQNSNLNSTKSFDLSDPSFFIYRLGIISTHSVLFRKLIEIMDIQHLASVRHILVAQQVWATVVIQKRLCNFFLAIRFKSEHFLLYKNCFFYLPEIYFAGI